MRLALDRRRRRAARLRGGSAAAPLRQPAHAGGNPNPNPNPNPNLNPNPNPNPNPSPSPNPNQLLTLLRGLTGTGGIGLLNLAYFNFLTFADACTPNPSSKPYP